MARTSIHEYEITRLRGRRAVLLGWIRAKSEKDAIEAAMAEYSLPEWVRGRLTARRMPDEP